MSVTELPALFTEGEGLIAAMERETLACLHQLESLPAEEIERFVARRQEIIAAIDSFCTELDRQLHCPDWYVAPGATASLEIFRQRQTEVLRRVVEAEGILLAVAVQAKEMLQTRLADIGQGRRALTGYRGKGRKALSSLDRNA